MSGTTVRLLAALALSVYLEAASALQTQVPPPSRESTSASAVVSGHVFDGSGEAPARFAQVQLSSRTLTGGTIRGTRYDTLTSEDGTFEFDAVQPGTYHLAALKLTYPPAFYSPDAGPAADPGAAIQIGVGQQLRDLNVHVLKGGVIAGKVTDQSGEPVSVPIALRRLTPATLVGDSPFYFDLPNYFRSDDQGNYRIYGLTPGDYFVMTDNQPSDTTESILPNGRRRTFARAFFPGTTDPMAAVPVSVVSGQECAGIDLTIRAVPLLRLSGTVAGPSDLPEHIGLFLAMVSPPTMFLQTQTGSTSNRQFVLSEVPPGRYWLSASVFQRPPADAPRGTAAVMWWATVPITISDRDVTDVVLALQPAMSLSGQIVVDQPAVDQPADMQRYAVSLTAIRGTVRVNERPAPGRPGEDGRFTIVNVMPGRYRLTVNASVGPPPQLVSLTVGGQELTNAEIEVSPGTNIENVVVRIRRP